MLRVDDGRTFSPFRADEVTVDFRRGVLSGSEPSRFLVLSGREKRFHLVERRRIVDASALKLVKVDRPYRLEWATRGLTPDGWTVAGRRATIRVYGAGLRRIAVVLAASRRAALPLDFTLRGAGQTRVGWVDPGGARPPIRINACLPANGFVDLGLKTRGSVRIPDGRLVGLHLDRVNVEAVATGPRCVRGSFR